MSITFGTYRLRGQVLEDSTNQAIAALTVHYSGTFDAIAAPAVRVDTAAQYGNASVLSQIAADNPAVQFGWKVSPTKGLTEGVQKGLKAFPRKGQLFRILLHNFTTVERYQQFEQAVAEECKDEDMPIGVCNVSAEQLRALVDNKCRVDWVQNELHPFLDSSVPALCKSLHIQFEAHSSLTALDKYPQVLAQVDALGGVCEQEKLQQREVKEQTTAVLPQTPAQLALAYAFAAGQGSVCVTTTNYAHLTELLAHTALSPSTQKRMEQMSRYVTVHGYKGAGARDASWLQRGDEAELRRDILPQLQKDIRIFEEGGVPSSLCVQLPKTHRMHGRVTTLVATMLYGEEVDEEGDEALTSNASTTASNTSDTTSDTTTSNTTSNTPSLAATAHGNRLTALLGHMRRRYEQHACEERRKKTAPSCAIRAVTDPSALPVDWYPDANTFTAFNQALGLDCKTDPPPVNLRFQYGTLCSDGRVDLCKQGIKPAFVEFCKSMQAATAMKHYLFGNNRLLDGADLNEVTARLDALVELVRVRTDIVTWFLAGNELDAVSIQPIMEAMSLSQAKYVWLKMNPIKKGAVHVGRMVARNAHVELVDLFNTGLQDSGLLAFERGLSLDGTLTTVPNLKHIYLAINGFTADAVPTLVKIVELCPNLESLFIGVNRWGDEGIIQLVPALKKLAHLRRFNVGSAGLTNAVLPALTDLVTSVPTLRALDLGTYRSTNYFKQVHNHFSDVDAVLSLVRDGELASINLRFTFPYFTVELLEAGLAKTNTLLAYDVLQYEGVGGRAVCEKITAQQWRALRQPLCVDHIQSIYRNTMK